MNENELTKIIFKKLGIEPNEKFCIGSNHNHYYINENLRMFDDNDDVISCVLNGTFITYLITRPELIIKKTVLTDVEKVILQNLDKEYKYIVRDKSSKLFLHEDKPYKLQAIWHNGKKFHEFTAFKHLFQFVKWEDEEPYLIEDLLKEEETK